MKIHPVANERRLGAIMLELGLLQTDQIEPILKAQRELGLPFGAAAMSLGLLTEVQLQQAMFSQFDYPYLVRGAGELSPQLVAAYEPSSPQVEVLRAIRGRLLLQWFTPGQRALAVVSTNNGDGRSFITANLGVVFSQLGENTLLIDANLRAPHLHELFKLDNSQGLSSILAGMAETDRIQPVPLLKNLSVLSAGPQPPNPGELLVRPVFTELLQELSTQYEVIFIDTPAGLICSETSMLAARAGGALTVARKHRTRLSDLRQLNVVIRDAGARLIGSVLNEY
ncbi:MAG: chain length determinant protein tyrosine kinase EpsG [Thiotrichaceae bacterium]|nr:chain length determinant protein tyrosine kinase EpsG [Thiotrichaceae bacterium]